MAHSHAVHLAGGNILKHGVLKLHISPDRVTVEVADQLHVLIKIHIRGEGYVGIVSGLEVGHTAGGYAQTPQHCEQRQRHIHYNSTYHVV